MGRPAKRSNVQSGGNPAMEFVMDFLRRKPTAAYAEVQAAAENKGHRIWPITYGRAQAMLGLTKKNKKKAGAAKTGRRGRPPGSTNRATAPVGAAPRRRGRPPKSAAAGLGAGSQDVMAGLTSAIEQLSRYRKALEEIANIAGSVTR